MTLSFDPETTCSSCRALINWEDAYEDAKGETICGECFDKKVDEAEARADAER